MGDQLPNPPPDDVDAPPKPRDPNVIPLWEIIFLVVVDFIMFFIFASLGQEAHSAATGLEKFGRALNLTVLFVVPWMVIGGVVGIFSGRGLYPIGQVIMRTLIACLIAVPVGVVLREAALTAPDLVGFTISLPFLLVALGVCTLLLTLWRLIWSRVRRLWWPEVP